MDVRIASSARKHGVSRKRIEKVLNDHSFAATLPVTGIDPKILYIGNDARGIEIEVIAVVLPSVLLVIHAMPAHFRRRKLERS